MFEAVIDRLDTMFQTHLSVELGALEDYGGVDVTLPAPLEYHKVFDRDLGIVKQYPALLIFSGDGAEDDLINNNITVDNIHDIGVVLLVHDTDEVSRMRKRSRYLTAMRNIIKKRKDADDTVINRGVITRFTDIEWQARRFVTQEQNTPMLDSIWLAFKAHERETL